MTQRSTTIEQRLQQGSDALSLMADKLDQDRAQAKHAADQGQAEAQKQRDLCLRRRDDAVRAAEGLRAQIEAMTQILADVDDRVSARTTELSNVTQDAHVQKQHFDEKIAAWTAQHERALGQLEAQSAEKTAVGDASKACFVQLTSAEAERGTLQQQLASLVDEQTKSRDELRTRRLDVASHHKSIESKRDVFARLHADSSAALVAVGARISDADKRIQQQRQELEKSRGRNQERSNQCEQLGARASALKRDVELAKERLAQLGCCANLTDARRRAHAQLVHVAKLAVATVWLAYAEHKVIKQDRAVQAGQAARDTAAADSVKAHAVLDQVLRQAHEHRDGIQARLQHLDDNSAPLQAITAQAKASAEVAANLVTAEVRRTAQLRLSVLSARKALDTPLALLDVPEHHESKLRQTLEPRVATFLDTDLTALDRGKRIRHAQRACVAIREEGGAIVRRQHSERDRLLKRVEQLRHEPAKVARRIVELEDRADVVCKQLARARRLRETTLAKSTPRSDAARASSMTAHRPRSARPGRQVRRQADYKQVQDDRKVTPRVAPHVIGEECEESKPNETEEETAAAADEPTHGELSIWHDQDLDVVPPRRKQGQRQAAKKWRAKPTLVPADEHHAKHPILSMAPKKKYRHPRSSAQSKSMDWLLEDEPMAF